MGAKAHWETIYKTKRPDQVSWFQQEASLSLALIRRIAPDSTAAIIDVGGGASTLIDGLLAAGYRELRVLDLSPTALAEARRRVGPTGAAVTWLEADVLGAKLPAAAFDVWHDRAVFHFLIEAADRARYVAQARQTVRPGGYVLVAAFAEDGPTQCSGLPVARYTADALYEEFGAGFRLVQSVREEHVTPSGAKQAFVYCLCQTHPPASKHHAA